MINTPTASSASDSKLQGLLTAATSVRSYKGPAACRTTSLDVWIFAARICRTPHSMHPSTSSGIEQLSLDWWQQAEQLQLLSPSSSCFVSISGAATSHWFEITVVPGENLITDLSLTPHHPEVAFLSHSQRHAMIITAEEHGNWILLARLEGGIVTELP